MTSNFAIGNTTAVAPASNVPRGDIDRVLNPTAINSGTPIYGNGPLMAAGPGRPNRPATPAAMMQSWSEILKKPVAPGATEPARFGKALFIRANPSKSTSASALFNNKDAKTWKVPGVPEFKGQIKGELMVGLDRALTAQRVQAFQSLSKGQQVTARTLIGAALQAMSLPKGDTGRIDPKHMDMVVETALKYAQQTPTALDGAAEPGAGTPTTKPVPPAPTTARTPTTQPVQPTQTARTPTSMPVAPATRSSPSATDFDPSSEFAPTTLWSDQEISDKVDQLAEQHKITQPRSIALMKDLLKNPALPLSRLAHIVAPMRGALNVPAGQDLRSALAEKVDMPYSALAARIGTKEDSTLGQRVMNCINPTHRDGVAELLLANNHKSGTEAEINLYRAMDSIFRSGDFKISVDELARSNPNVGASAFNIAIKSLSNVFNPGRISMLRTMGFTHVQILRMSAVGNELHRRFDPSLGTYSKNEQHARRKLNLPINQEEAAERLLSARYRADNYPLSYRDKIVLGLLSDQPWLNSNGMSTLVSRFNPNVSPTAGTGHVSHVITAANRFVKNPVRRGQTADFQNPEYIHDSQRKALQIFGLGARDWHTGTLQPIPTDFQIRQSPSSRAPDAPRLVRQAPSEREGPDNVHWRELLPLLQNPSARGQP